MKPILILAAAMALYGTAARADSLANTFFPGHGDPQNNFTVVNDTTDDIQLGLSAQQRGSTAPPVGGLSNTYFAQPSSSYIWNFDFVIDTNPDGKGTLSLSDLTANLSVTGPGGLSGSFDPLAVLDDNPIGSTTLAQNSENLKFSSLFEPPVGTGSPIGFNPDVPGDYTFTLTVNAAGGGPLLATDTITVDVVPLPSAAGMGIASLGAVGFGLLLRKRFRAA